METYTRLIIIEILNNELEAALRAAVMGSLMLQFPGTTIDAEEGGTLVLVTVPFETKAAAVAFHASPEYRAFASRTASLRRNMPVVKCFRRIL